MMITQTAQLKDLVYYSYIRLKATNCTKPTKKSHIGAILGLLQISYASV